MDEVQTKCIRCGDEDHDVLKCPYVKAANFDADMNIVRLEFLTPADYGVRTAKVGDESMSETDYPKMQPSKMAQQQ